MSNEEQKPNLLFQAYMLAVGMFGPKVPTTPLNEKIQPINSEVHLSTWQRKEQWETGEAVKPLPGPSAAQRRVNRENEILFGKKL